MVFFGIFCRQISHAPLATWPQSPIAVGDDFPPAIVVFSSRRHAGRHRAGLIGRPQSLLSAKDCRRCRFPTRPRNMIGAGAAQVDRAWPRGLTAANVQRPEELNRRRARTSSTITPHDRRMPRARSGLEGLRLDALSSRGHPFAVLHHKLDGPLETAARTAGRDSRLPAILRAPTRFGRGQPDPPILQHPLRAPEAHPRRPSWSAMPGPDVAVARRAPGVPVHRPVEFWAYTDVSQLPN